MTRSILAGIATLAILLGTGGRAVAGPITITVGDNDGYGLGIPDNGPASWTSPPLDNRSPAEAAATNGAQFTDVYSSLFPAFGPNGVTTGNVVFNLGANILNSGTLTVDMGDFQASAFGQFLVSFNGVVQPGLFNFNDGFQNTAVRSFVLSPAAIANANAAGQFVVTINRNGSGDFVAFDYFQLNADTTQVPEPATLAVFGGIALAGALGFRRRKATVA